MADKYIRHGATFNGDGTSSALAASNGGVGAWNSITILTGTAPSFGALAAGDTVHIRSKDEAGADVTVTNATSGANIGSASASLAGPITWDLDDGVIWPGVSGTLTYSTTNTFNLRLWNIFISAQDKWVWYVNTSAPNSTTYMAILGIVNGGLIDFSLKTNTANAGINVSGTLENTHIKYGRIGLNSIFTAVNNNLWALTNVDIELLYPLGEGLLINRISGGYSQLRITGGRLRGVGATTGFTLLGGAGSGLDLVAMGFEFPKTVTLCSVFTLGWSAYGMGADSGSGAWIVDSWGIADSRDDNFYPKLDATLPTSTGQGWSWKLYPANADRYASNMKLPLAKYFTDTAAIKTLAVNVLVADTLAYDKSSLWIEAYYIDDATGEPKFLTSKATGALATSTASWSATTYGSSNFLKYKLQVTTPTSIKKDTLLTVVVRGTVKTASALDILFLDPDVAIA